MRTADAVAAAAGAAGDVGGSCDHLELALDLARELAAIVPNRETRRAY